MTTSNEADNDIVSATDTVGDAITPPCATEDHEAVTEDTETVVPLAEQVINEARRVEQEAEALAAEAIQYAQEMLQKLHAFAMSADADSCETTPEPAGSGEPDSEANAACGAAKTANIDQFTDGIDKPATLIKEATNMGNEPAFTSKTALVDRILAGSAGIQAAEEAVQSALKTFMDATSNEVMNLVKNNTHYPEIREDMLKIEKRLMEMTLEAIESIQDRVPKPPEPKAKDKP